MMGCGGGHVGVPLMLCWLTIANDDHDTALVATTMIGYMGFVVVFVS